MNKLKRILSALLAACLCITTAFAIGDGNMEGGGGNTGDGSQGNYWNVGDDGVRVTIVRESNFSSVTTPIDYTNKQNFDNKIIHFGLTSKLSYSAGKSLSAESKIYDYATPESPLPTIITANGRTNIKAVKEYFGREGTIQGIAKQTGIPFETLINGNYVILIEPIAYLTYGGKRYAMTATEAALFNRKTDGDLKRKMGYLTHQNLPLAMFLERPDLGYPAWSGPTTGIRADSEIIAQLGLGTVRFTEGPCCNHAPDCPCITDPDNPNDCECKKEHPDQPCGPDSPGCECVPAPPIEVPDYVYHTDTDVITSFYIYDASGSEDGINPDMNAKASIDIAGKKMTQSYVVPPNESTLVWFRWHTPTTPQTIRIPVTVTGGGRLEKDYITVEVRKLEENTPPDPQPTDLSPNGYNPWEPPDVPDSQSNGSLKWGKWKPWWHENWEWESNWEWVGSDEDGSWVDNGEWVDNGWWEYDYEEYSASASMKPKVEPDKEVPTAERRGTTYEMKSGYGVTIEVSTSVYGNGSSEDFTGLQNCMAFFPEFDYATYNRVLEQKTRGYGASYQLRVNEYSRKGLRDHYTPIWFPDDAKYEPQIVCFDAWTPAGQLYLYDSDYIYINGDVYDDWNISPVKIED